MNNTKMELDFEKLFKISLTAMKLNRLHPDIPRGKKWVLEVGIMHTIFTIIYGILTYDIILAVHAGKYTEACTHGILSIIYLYITITYGIQLKNRDTITKLMKLMKDDFEKDLPHDEKMIVLKYAKKGRKVCVIWLLLTFITGGTFSVKHIAVETYLYITGEFELIMPYPFIYPSPFEEIKMHPVVYTISYLIMIYYASYSSFTYVSFMPLGPAFMLHACGQLEIIKGRTLQLFTVNKEEEIRVKMTEMVKHLQYVYDIIEDINKIFGELYEVTLRGSSGLLSVTMFGILWSISSGIFSIELINFLIAGTVISCLPCYYSDMLMDKGEEVRFAIYSSGWEKIYDHKSRTTILVILQRALRPTCILTMFRTVSLDALTDMFQQAYTLLNLMNVAWG